MMNVNETWSFPELSHQDGDLIIGISAFQTLDESAYSFNIWNPAKNALDTLIWYILKTRGKAKTWSYLPQAEAGHRLHGQDRRLQGLRHQEPREVHLGHRVQDKQ